MELHVGNSTPARDQQPAERLLLEALPAAIYVCRPNGTIEWHNRRAAELWGRAPEAGDGAERFCGAHRVYGPDGAPLPRDETPVARVLRTGRPVRDVELTIERPDGSRGDVLVSAAPLPGDGGDGGDGDDAGAAGGVVSCLVDVTDRTREAALVAARERELADFFENSAIGLHWIGPEGRILRANRAELAMLGCSAEEYVGHNIAE